MFSNRIQNFFKATILSVFAAIVIVGLSLSNGKINFFLMLNIDLGVMGDFIFNYLTYLGDGLILIPFSIFILLKKRNDFILYLLAIIISTLLAHYVKGHLISYNPRPIELIKNWQLVHTIPNITVHNVGSFPSGHSTQVFVLFYLFCVMYDSKLVLWGGFTLALLVGYSRVYQAQHFPIDVAGGIIVAWLSVAISLAIIFIFSNKQRSL
jgi:membrane-associated phospholipid phosphatase